jgi:hypothetical protein
MPRSSIWAAYPNQLGWLAGIAGPIRDGESIGSAWSSFKRWESMPPEEHFDKLYRVAYGNCPAR